MRKLFSPNGAFTKKAVIVGAALAVVVALSYFGSSNYLNQSIMDMLMGGTSACDCLADEECGNCPTYWACGGAKVCPSNNPLCSVPVGTCSDICDLWCNYGGNGSVRGKYKEDFNDSRYFG